MLKKILFATTVSPECDDAARYAFDLAKKSNATLCIFHVFGIPSHGFSHYVINIKTGAQEFYSDEYDQIVLDEMTDRYAEYLKEYNNTTIECTIGDPSSETLKKVKKEGFDIIIMGAHQKVKNHDSVRYGNLTGDTMQQVARGARCPVMLIGQSYDRNLWELNSVLCAIDFSRASMPAFRFAVRVARENECRIYLFHALDIHQQMPGESKVNVEKKIKDTLKKLEKRYKPELGEYKDYVFGIQEGVPYAEILKYAREHSIDLIAMGHHSGSIFNRKDKLGSTTEEVVIRSSCPVASVNRMEVLDGYEAFLSD